MKWEDRRTVNKIILVLYGIFSIIFCIIFSMYSLVSSGIWFIICLIIFHDAVNFPGDKK